MVTETVLDTPFAVFRHLAIEGPQSPPTPEELRAIEALLGAELPASFVEFLHVANGGYLEYVIDVPTESGGSEELSFCGIFATRSDEPVPYETFLYEIQAARETARVPEGVLPFARDGGGSAVFLDLTPEGAGRVVAFVMGLPAWTGSKRHVSAFIPVADSFDDYVAKLRLDREAILDHLTHDVREAAHVAANEAFLDIGMPEWRGDEELVRAVAEAKRRLE